MARAKDNEYKARTGADVDAAVAAAAVVACCIPKPKRSVSSYSALQVAMYSPNLLLLCMLLLLSNCQPSLIHRHRRPLHLRRAPLDPLEVGERSLELSGELLVDRFGLLFGLRQGVSWGTRGERAGGKGEDTDRRAGRGGGVGEKGLEGTGGCLDEVTGCVEELGAIDGVGGGLPKKRLVDGWIEVGETRTARRVDPRRGEARRRRKSLRQSGVFHCL